VLGFHTFHDQLSRLSLHRPQRKQASSDDSAPTPVVNEEAELEQHATPSLHLVGHSAIQAAIEDISEMLAKDGRTLIVQPKSETVALADIKPRLLLSGDGSVRMITRFKTDDESWEAHGIPHSSSYILLALQLGLGATTGYANTSLAHSRRGVKRDRDIKVLRHLGYASMIFCDAANFALGRPLTDGTVVESEEAVCESIFNRIGNLITKSEGWPNGTGHLSELCSSNVTTLISGFVAQVVRDIRGTPNASNASEASEASEVFEGRTISVYLPRGEFRLPGLARAVALFFHAIVADLAEHTSGTCFTRARTKYFDDFMNGRTTAERDDLVIRREVSQEVASQMIYQPGINERYLLPESSRPPRGTQIFLLLEQGFELFIDQKQIEEFEAKDFRPEFTLHEDQGDAPAIDAIALGPQKINWFELSPKFFFKGVEITGDQALRLSKDGMIEFQGRLYRIKANELPSLKRLTQFWAKIQANAPSPLRAKRRRTEDTYYQLPRSQTLELLALRASGVKVRGGDRWQEITDFYDSLGSEREALEISSTFKTELQPYQKVGVQWLNDLNKLGLGGILADDMGLGKTVTTLAFLENQRVKGTMGATLVLVPTSLTYNWLAESERFAPQIPTLIFHSRMPESMLDFIQSNQQCLVICTYGLLQENSELFQQVEWNIIAFDEAQNLKNITTKRTNAARKLRTSFRVCLTGTPLENHYGEFFSLFDLIVPGSLGELSDFREKYVNPVHVLREDIDDLKLKTKPLILRRTKSQVMTQLPEKIETTIRLPFEDEQKRIYRDIATAYNDQIRSQIAVHGESKLQLQMLTALLRLRQACSDPSAIPGVQYTGEPPKITTLAEALQQITESGASALVFTQFLATFERIRRTLSGLNILHFDISGADSRLQREKKLRAFQDQTQGAVMLMTLKTGGVGLNLTKANYVFHIEPWWNPAVENQATDRAHRIGQLETVQVYRYLIRESVEEKIEVLKDLKSKRFDALFSTSENDNELGPSGSALTQKDFEFLLS
jgi:superfamily II DNA or RNA helicase